MVGHFVENVAPCRTLPGDALHGDVTTITRTCLELALSLLDGRDIPDKTKHLENAAAAWAREGVPIDTIHHAIHEGFKIGFDLAVTNTTAGIAGQDPGEQALTEADYTNLLTGTRLLVEILDTMTTAVSGAYVRELRSAVSEHHNAVHTLTSALLAGHPTSTMARECGIEIADAYHVLALHIPPHPDQRNPHLNPTIVARRKLRRVQTALATGTTATTLSLLSTGGGTLLIPTTRSSTGHLDTLLAHLSRAGQVPITAATTTASPEGIPTAAEQTHQLLDMVTRLDWAPALYRFDDLALEYQLTRPGPGRDHLRTLLAPLDHHPELLTTLQTHIANNLNRQRTARLLHIHTNTVDYRLKRIAQLTGLDPTQTNGLWYLRSALIARTYTAS
ncbi:MAG: helix-turn-helix domain-containing protein [Nocardia sp.]|nr:helix-turn-helix domain-containing protein [Nocardia sp.]